MAQYDELTGLLRELLTNRFSPKPRYINGLLGDGLGNVVVPDRPDKVYARFSKESTTYFEIFNVTVPKVNNWPVKIGELPWNPGLTQVVGTNWSAFEQAGWGDVLGSTSPHAPTHEWPDGSPGSDVVDVHLRAIVPGRAFVSSGAPTTIFVNSFEYGTTGTLWPGLPGVDLQPVMSATATGTMRYAGVYVDEATNSLGVVTGGTTVFTSALEPPRVSFPGSGVIPIARVRVYGGQAGPVEADIKDARRLWDSGGGGAGASFNDAEGDPAAIANPAADGTSVYAARRDHVHPYSISLDGLSDVNTSGAVSGDVLTLSGATWIANPPPESAFPGPGEVKIDDSGDLASISTAIASASPGDVILIGAGTYTEDVALNKAVTLRGIGPRGSVIITNATATHTIVATASATLENLTINNTAAGTQIACISVGATTNTTVRDCILNKTGASTTGVGYYFAGTGHRLIDTEITVSGATTNHAVRNDTADGAVTITRGKLTGADASIFSNRAGTTVTLEKTILANAISHSGTLSGSWFDSGYDIHLAGDRAGIKARTINTWITPTDHFTAFSGYTWSTTAGVHDGTPGTIDVTTNPDILMLNHASAPKNFFAYTAKNTTSLDARLRASVPPGAYVGLRFDDGSDDNYVEMRIEIGSATDHLRLQSRVRAGGGAVTSAYYVDFLPAAFYMVRINRGATSFLGYYAVDLPIPFAVASGGSTFTITRAGIIYGLTSANQRCWIDWQSGI